MKKRRIKKSIIKKLIILILLVIAGITTKITIDTMKYHKTNEYKLKKIGYTIEEIKTITSDSDNNINYVLTNEYNQTIVDIMSQKYYLHTLGLFFLHRYLLFLIQIYRCSFLQTNN